MKTVALRFADNFAPSTGTIFEHRLIIEKSGFAWYGKLGTPVSQNVAVEILKNESPKILLIHSGKAKRYWAFVEEIKNETPPLEYIPPYYRNEVKNFKTWFKLIKIEDASKHVISHCKVASSGRPLSEVSKSSMSPYFIIEVEE